MEGSDSLVSIIVPVYGTEAYLPACIESICRQTYPNIQIVLVDDQSPDGCPKICDQYAEKDPRIVVIHQENKGVSGARNAGLHCATGDFVMFVDSDDELCQHAVEILYRDAVEHKADIVSACMRLVNEEGIVVEERGDGSYEFYQNDQSVLLALQANQNTDSVVAKLYRKEALQDILFEEGKNVNEDGFFLFKCFLKNPVLVQHNACVYQCNIRSGSISRRTFSDEYLAIIYYCSKKRELVMSRCPQHAERFASLEMHTYLQMLDLLCRTTDRKYRQLQRQCENAVKRLYKQVSLTSKHNKMLAWVVKFGLYSLYKRAIRMKYYR